MNNALTPAGQLSPRRTLSGLTPVGLERYAKLKPIEKQKVRDYIEDIFPALAKARSTRGESVERAARELAQKYKHRAVTGKKHSGYSARSMINKFERYRKEGNGDFLLPAYQNAARRSKADQVTWDAFKAWWITWATSNQRDDGTRGAYDMFIRDVWASGQNVPGFGTWQQWFAKSFPTKELPARCPVGKGDLPRGWSYENLLRQLPRDSVVTGLRKGFFAAHGKQAIMRRSRADLMPLQYIAIDDFWIDQYVYVDGQAAPCRAVGILAIDVATGLVLGHFCKPRTEDEFGKRAGIRQSEVNELLLMIMQSTGLPSWPITFIAEHGSAAISPEIESLLNAHIGDAVRIQRTGLYHDFMRKHGFEERGGKAWIKGWVESFFRVLHTHAGHLPGQSGPSYSRKPGDLDAKLRYTKKLLENPDFDQDDLQKLRLPLMHISEAQAMYGHIIALLDERTNHRLRGFDSVREWRYDLGDPWRHSDELPNRLDPSGLKWRERVESPLERYTRLLRGKRLRPVPDECLYYLYPKTTLTTIRNGEILIQDKAISRDGIPYFDGGDILRTNEGSKVKAWCLPNQPDHILLTTPEADLMQQRFIGRIEAAPIPSLDDEEAIQKTSGLYRRDRMADLRTARTIASGEDRLLKQDKQFNRYLKDQAADRRKLKQQGARTDDARIEDDDEQFLSTAPAPVSEHHDDDDDLNPNQFL